MQRTAIFLACFFICANCFAQQYPFVHYTPKDGLISNSIRNVYQDSKGRLYFTSINGLSVYDGARFTNYNSKNGLVSDIVNCVMQMGNDSVWVITNSEKIQCLVNGKLRSLVFNGIPPPIDNLVRDKEGNLYAASEQGLFLFKDNRFKKLSLPGMNNFSVKEYIGSICPVDKYLLITRDNAMLDARDKYLLYLYDPTSEKIIAQTQNERIYQIAKAPDGAIWVSTNKKILAIDTINLKKGKISFQELPPPYDKIITNGLSFFSFDQYGNCWMTDKVFVLKKVTSDGNEISFTRESGLNTMDISHVFQDKEGTTWIASFGEGVYKLVNSNFSFSNTISGVSAISSFSYSAEKDQMILYSPNISKAIIIENNKNNRTFEVGNSNKFPQVFITPKGLFGYSNNAICELNISGNRLYPRTVFLDSVDNLFQDPLIDNNGNAILCGKDHLTAIIDAKTIYRKKISYFSDQAAMDKIGNIWVATRAGELIMYKPNPDDPSNYLSNETIVSKKIPDISPRSIAIDRSDNIWIGSRNDGIRIFKVENSDLIRKFSVTTATGLSDNFITQLTCDNDDNIWVCTPSGLDKITLKNGAPVVENLTKQNNIYQKVFKVVIDKNNTAWVLTSNGIIRITKEITIANNYSPTLMMSMIKTGKDTISNHAGLSLSHKQNNLSFYFAATSFINEKLVLYSYRLRGGSNTQWSEPTNNSTVTFIDLPPGNYSLDIKANFPAGRYPEQNINYKFSIAPPWWQTWWLRSIAGLLIIGLLIISIRYYYSRKLEKERILLEKQQAIEKERTRIASDMHDDLGAGLSSIRFLSEKVKRNVFSDITKNDIEKMQFTSSELMEKMNEIVWAMSEKNDSLEDLLFYTRSYAKEYCEENNLNCNIRLPENIPAFFVRGEIRRNVFLTVKESLHNIVKHAEAQKVNIDMNINDSLEIKIRDDGKGFNGQHPGSPGGNGLRNMQKRISSIGGTIDINNGQGITVVMKVPLVPI